MTGLRARRRTAIARCWRRRLASINNDTYTASERSQPACTTHALSLCQNSAARNDPMTAPIMSSKMRRRVRCPRRHESRATFFFDEGTTTMRPRVLLAGWRGAISSMRRRQR